MPSTALLGLVFLVVGLASMFLMFHLWRYPFDKETRTSSAPRWAMRLHRALGYVFLILYVVLMWNMVPRLWEYQIEFPARTTAHLILGFTIGFLLIVKLSIAWFFRHFEEWMPYLGTAIMLCTVLLLGLSLPFVLQESALASSAPGGDVASPKSLARLTKQLPNAGLPASAPLRELASERALENGRGVLLGSCVKCHDLRTILYRPRTPSGWWSTVERMAEKPALFEPMTETEMYEVTAYLIAITPDLQKSQKARYQDELEREAAITEAVRVEGGAGMGSDVAPGTTPTSPDTTWPAAPPSPDPPGTNPGAKPGTERPGTTPPPAQPPAAKSVVTPKPVDLAVAKRTYERVCSQCHELSDVDSQPPKTRAESRAMVRRMIRENDAELTATEINLVTAWLDAHFVENKQ